MVSLIADVKNKNLRLQIEKVSCGLFKNYDRVLAELATEFATEPVAEFVTESMAVKTIHPVNAVRKIKQFKEILL